MYTPRFIQAALYVGLTVLLHWLLQVEVSMGYLAASVKEATLHTLAAEYLKGFHFLWRGYIYK